MPELRIDKKNTIALLPGAPVVALLVCLSILAPLARAVTTTIDFENLPALAAQPNNFAAAGAAQTYTSAGVFSIGGGVVLGNPTFLPAFPLHGTVPNLYGTADFADPSLLSTITLTLPTTTQLVTNVSGVLFNGQPVAESYTVTAFSGVTQVDIATFNNVPASSSATAFANFSLNSTALLPITSVLITTPNSAANGWDFFVDSIVLTATLVPTAPDLSIAKSHIGNFTQGTAGVYTITVTNTGTASTTGITTVTDTLPTGLSFVSGTGGGFTCSAIGQIVTCNNPSAITVGPPGAVITLTVNVLCSAAATVTNSVMVTNPNITADPDDSTTDLTTINPSGTCADLSIVKSHVGNFTQGTTGAYSIRVTNTGTASTAGTTVVTDTLPAGLSFVSGTGGGFTCSAIGQTVTCNNPSAITVGPPGVVITLTVTVAANAPATVTNSVMVTNPNITADPDDSTTDPTTINAAAAGLAGESTGVYQLRYLANLQTADSYINATNAGTFDGFDPNGRICANFYVFDPREELVSCCSCLITPNGLVSLSARNDLINNTLTGAPLTNGITVKVLSSLPTPVGGTTCSPSSPTAATLVPGLKLWAVTPHGNTGLAPPPPATSAFGLAETEFAKAELSANELAKLTGFCRFIQVVASNFGICRSCPTVGAQGVDIK